MGKSHRKKKRKGGDCLWLFNYPGPNLFDVIFFEKKFPDFGEGVFPFSFCSQDFLPKLGEEKKLFFPNNTKAFSRFGLIFLFSFGF